MITNYRHQTDVKSATSFWLDLADEEKTMPNEWLLWLPSGCTKN